MSSVEVVKSKQKKRIKLLIDGHYFLKVTVKYDITYWCCDKKSILQCKSTVRTQIVDGKYEIIYGPTEHSHGDPKNRKLIVATPRKNIFRRSLRLLSSRNTMFLDFQDPSTTVEHETDAENETITSRKKKQPIPFADKPIKPDFGVKEIKFIRWSKSQKHKLFIDGFYYAVHRINVCSCQWICTINECRARLTTVFRVGSHILKTDPTKLEHTHDAGYIAKSISRYLDTKPLDNHVTELTFSKKYGGECIPFVDKPIKSDFGVKEIKFIRWTENQKYRLFIDGYYYVLKCITKKACTWKCCKSVSHCPVSIKTYFDENGHKLKVDHTTVNHNHDVTDIPLSIKRCSENLPSTSGDQCEREVLRVENKCESPQLEPPAESDVSKNLADVSMHTQLLNLIPQEEAVEFQPPADCEIEFVILFGLRRQMTPEQIFYELQGIYHLDAPSFEVISEYCERFRGGYYPINDLEPKWTSNMQLVDFKTELNEDPNSSKEFLTIKSEIDI